jgi:hypothetical protein
MSGRVLAIWQIDEYPIYLGLGTESNQAVTELKALDLGSYLLYI